MKRFPIHAILRVLFLPLSVTCPYLVEALTSEQKPLVDHHEAEGPVTATSSRWNFNFSSAAPHYFASAYGLLQQWPNTFFPNGQTIAPCEISPFTKLYHGRQDGEIPPSPEWVAFDIGMSYGIMGSSRNTHILTYQTTRPMKCIYFDGESAALFGRGQLDSQMLHIYGNVSGPPQDHFWGLYDEYARANGLCDWLSEKNLGGLGWGFEGIVRMNAGFEMIMCNFSSPSLRLVSHLNVTAPLLPAPDEDESQLNSENQPDISPTSYYPLPPSTTRSDRSENPSNPPAPPNWRWAADREPFVRSQGWGWFESATAHYGSSGLGPGAGETRVKPLTCGILSYYSPIFSSQANARAEKEQSSLNLTTEGLWTGPGMNGSRTIAIAELTRRRRAHTLEDVSPSDAARMREISERALHGLLGASPNCSGIDWMVMTNEIVQSHAENLAALLTLLASYRNLTNSNETVVREWMGRVRDHTHTFLLPYFEYPDSTGDDTTGEDIWSRKSALFRNTYSRCQFHHTRLLDPEAGFVYLGPEESTLKWAVEETTGGICSVLVDVGLSVEGLWESRFNKPVNTTAATTGSLSLEKEINRWFEGVQELMAWLGWAGEWVSCEKRCGWDEKCFIPMWPLMARRRMGGGPGRGPPRGGPGNETRPGWGGWRPGYDLPYRYGGGPTRSPGRGGGAGFGWAQDETDLWEPRCVKIEYIMG